MANFIEKRKVKKEIKICLQTIAEIERRRNRSQAALLQAILMHQPPENDDVEWFNKYTGEIAACRKRLEELQKQLDSLK